MFSVLWVGIYVLEAPYRIARRKTVPQEWQLVDVREWLQIIELREVEPAIIGTNQTNQTSQPTNQRRRQTEPIRPDRSSLLGSPDLLMPSLLPFRAPSRRQGALIYG